MTEEITFGGPVVQGRTNSIDVTALVQRYQWAKEYIVKRGFGPEVHWQDSLRLELLEEQSFLREVGWVILNSGMRETVVRGLFPRITTAFGNWTSARSIATKRAQCRKAALRVFAHQGKIGAILEV